jgi:hypothetical protein
MKRKSATVPYQLRRITMKQFLSRRGKISLAIAITLIVALAGTAFGVSNLLLQIGTISSYDFGGYGPGYPVPGSVQIQGFTIRPGDTVPWHYHKGVSYVVLAHGTLTETHLVGANQCASEVVHGGDAFVEGLGAAHTITNTGHDVAVIWWATIYPQSDGPGGIYLVDPPPTCN